MPLASFNRDLLSILMSLIWTTVHSICYVWVLPESLDWMNFLINELNACISALTTDDIFTLLFIVFYLWWWMASCLGTLEICAGIVVYNYLIWGEGWCQEKSFRTWHGYVSRIFFPTTQMWGRFIFTFEINLLECIKMWWLVLIYCI